MALNVPINTATSGYSRAWRRQFARVNNLTSAAFRILQAYGTDAHLWLPSYRTMRTAGLT